MQRMRKTLPLILFLLLAIDSLKSQEKKSYVIKAGESVSEVVPFGELYAYPVFTKGTAYFRNGDISVGMLNYNILSAEMEFISASGDTLALADEPLVKMIALGNDSFFFNEGYISLISSQKGFKLGKRSVFTTAKIEKTGAYDQPMPANMQTFSGISNGARIAGLIVRENITLVKETAYYFGDKNNEFLPATRKNLRKTFPKQEKNIENYLSKNEVNFGKEEDLKKLVEFLQSL